jgi:hypothetical protein
MVVSAAIEIAAGATSGLASAQLAPALLGARGTNSAESTSAAYRTTSGSSVSGAALQGGFAALVAGLLGQVGGSYAGGEKAFSAASSKATHDGAEGNAKAQKKRDRQAEQPESEADTVPPVGPQVSMSSLPAPAVPQHFANSTGFPASAAQSTKDEAISPSGEGSSTREVPPATAGSALRSVADATQSGCRNELLSSETIISAVQGAAAAPLLLSLATPLDTGKTEDSAPQSTGEGVSAPIAEAVSPAASAGSGIAVAGGKMSPGIAASLSGASAAGAQSSAPPGQNAMDVNYKVSPTATTHPATRSDFAQAGTAANLDVTAQASRGGTAQASTAPIEGWNNQTALNQPSFNQFPMNGTAHIALHATPRAFAESFETAPDTFVPSISSVISSAVAGEFSAGSSFVSFAAAGAGSLGGDPPKTNLSADFATASTAVQNAASMSGTRADGKPDNVEVNAAAAGPHQTGNLDGTNNGTGSTNSARSFVAQRTDLLPDVQDAGSRNARYVSGAVAPKNKKPASVKPAETLSDGAEPESTQPAEPQNAADAARPTSASGSAPAPTDASAAPAAAAPAALQPTSVPCVIPAIGLDPAQGNGQKADNASSTSDGKGLDQPTSAKNGQAWATLVSGAYTANAGQPEPGVRAAQLVDSVNSSGLRIGMRTEQLGPVRIDAVVDAGRVKATIHVEQTVSSDMLAGEIPQLASALRQHNLELASFSLLTGGEGQQHQPQQQPNYEQRNPPVSQIRETNEAQENDGAADALAVQPAEPGRLNVNA